MTRSQLNSFRRILERKQAELRPSFQTRNDIAIERSADMLDAIQLAGARELAGHTLSRAAKMSRDVRAALARIDEGVYGICADCEEEIDPKRLNAVPWAPLCIRCQELSDRGGHPGFEHRRYLADAA
jgi:DnaK suppressor protein